MDPSRATFLGASDMAAVVGWSPFRTALDVWCEKCGFTEPPRETPFTRAGKRLEPVIAEWYADDLAEDHCPVRLEPCTTVTHPRLPFLRATPDRWVIPADKRRTHWLLEAKSTAQSHAREWGTPGTDLIPAHYLAQCDVQMACTGLDRVDVAVLIGGHDFRRYTIVRNLEEEEWLVEAAEQFWRDFVEPQKPPPLDGSPSALAYLEKKHPTPVRERMISSNIETDALAAQYRIAAAKAQRATDKKNSLRVQLCASIGDAAGIEGDGWEVTWRGVRDRTLVDWREVALGLQTSDPVRFGELVSRWTSHRPGGRRFRAVFAGEECGGGEP